MIFISKIESNILGIKIKSSYICQLLPRNGTVAQSVEHATENRGVGGSIPPGPTSLSFLIFPISHQLYFPGFSAKKVLIVEDDNLLSMVAERLVQKIGHNVVAKVGNGRNAIAEIEKKCPDVVLMDIRLNGDLDGIDTVKEIKKKSSVSVIYLSGSSYPKSYDRAENTEYEAFLQKPLQIQELKKAFQNIFETEKVVRPQNKKKVG